MGVVGGAAPSADPGAVWRLLEAWLMAWMARWMGRRGPAGERGLEAVARLFDMPESPSLMYLEAVPYLSGRRKRVAARNVAGMLRGRCSHFRLWRYALGRTIGSRRVAIRRWRRTFARKINFTRRLGTVFPRRAHGVRVEDHCDPPVGLAGSRKVLGSSLAVQAAGTREGVRAGKVCAELGDPG